MQQHVYFHKQKHKKFNLFLQHAKYKSVNE